MSKTKIIWGTAGSIFLVGALIAGISLVFQNQNIVRKAAPATTLSIVPGSQNKSPNDSFSLAVKMDTGSNQSSGFDLVISFNPQVFQVSNITQGSVVSGFSVIKNTIDNNSGKISYSVFTTDTTKAITGSGLAILNISATVKPGATSGTYNFTFDSGSAVAGLGEGQNVLMGTNPGSIVIASVAGPTATATPTPVPTTQGATPTPTSTLSPGATTKPTVTPTTSSGTSSGSTSNTTPVATPRPIPVTGLSLPTVALGIVGFVAVMITFVIVVL